MGFIRKYLSADGLMSVVKHGLLREKFKIIKNSEYSWNDCIMSGLAVFGFKMPSLLQFEKDHAHDALVFNRPSPAVVLQGLSKSTKSCWTINDIV